jgi:deoxyribose-phosphate aldolase
MPLDKLYIKPNTAHSIPKNQGMPFEKHLLDEIYINLSAVERRCNSLIGRRTVKNKNQALWLLRAISCLDLTTLSGDDTAGKVGRLCAKALNPVNTKFFELLGLNDKKVTVGAVCVYHQMVNTAVISLKHSSIPVAAVSTGFPAGLSPQKTKIMEIKESLKQGAREIDIVISRRHVLTGNWKKLYDEVSEYREACGDSCLKTILATGELGTLRNIAKASWVCMMAGADFIKTSTGKETINATLPFSLVMVRAIRDYHDLTGSMVGYKPAGGISTAKESLSYMMLINEELGGQWLSPSLFRLGASSLLIDIERQLEHFSTGKYSAFNRHGIS